MNDLIRVFLKDFNSISLHPSNKGDFYLCAFLFKPNYKLFNKWASKFA
jgi:hypothetical protein